MYIRTADTSYTPTKINLIFSTALSYWVIGLPLAYILGFPLGMKVLGIWIGLFAGLACAALLLVIRFHLKTKEKD